MNATYIYQVERDLLKKVIKRNAHYLKGRVLDVGSGPFKRYAGLFSKIDQYLTLDINPDFKPDIIGRAEEIPVPSNSFDGILCTQVLGCIFYLDKAIKEFYRILKQGGIVFLTDGFLTELHGDLDFWRFTPYSLTSLFEKNNFEVLKIEPIGGFFSVKAQMNMRFLINSLNLYKHKILGKIFSKIFQIYGKLAIFLDDIVKTKASQRFSLGFLIIARKI